MQPSEEKPTPIRINHDLLALRVDVYELEQLAARRIRLAHSGAHGGVVSAPTPVNLAAGDLLDQILVLSRRLADAVGLRYAPNMDAYDLLKGVARPAQCERLAAREDAWHVVRLVTAARGRAARLLDPDAAHRLVGRCDRCGYGVWVAERTPVGARLRCELCGHLMDLEDVARAQYLRLRVSSVVGTASELARLLRSCGYPAKRKTITEWHRRGRLLNVAHPSDPPAYRIGDVLALLDANHCGR